MESAMQEAVRVLAGILHVGEPSLPRTLESLAAQQGIHLEQLLIGHLPEREAHRRLYEGFTAATLEHELLVKVDADMELVEPRLLVALGTLLRRHPEVERVVLGVDDWFTGQRIHGMLAWRGGTRWTSPPPELFTDLATDTAIGKFKLIDAGRPLVLHAADPTDEQALRYGAHRALKAEATGRASRLGTLQALVSTTDALPERGRRLAVTAVSLAFEDPELGARCIGGDAMLLPADRERIEARAAEPSLIGLVEAALETRRMTATDAAEPAEEDDASTDAGLRRRSLLRRGAGRLQRMLRGRPSGRPEPDQAALREEFLTLLDA
jgi:hypothetical protein